MKTALVLMFFFIPCTVYGDWVQDNMRWQQQQQQIQNKQQERVLGYSYGSDNESISRRLEYEKAQKRQKLLDDAYKDLAIEANAVEDHYNSEKARVIKKYTEIYERLMKE